MKEIVCKIENKSDYRIIIQNGLLGQLTKLSNFFGQYKNIVIITDKNVAKYYLPRVKKQLRRIGVDVFAIIVNPGESSKTLAEVEEIYYKLQNIGVTRSDLIIALGGGVVGDLAGFVAATYLRGIDFVQMPTSLLAMVDSSVGGKVGVDLGFTKNIIGAFYQPKLVLTDPKCLETLDDKFLVDGMAEVIKYGCIASSKLFLRLLSFQYQEDLLEDMEEIISKCVTIKRNVVQSDEKESGIRRILNFGHTIGHVIESYFKFRKYTHGEAVAIGMYQITKMSTNEGMTNIKALENLKIILETYGLPWEMPEMDLKKVAEILSKDKKFEGDTLNVCIIPKIGKSSIVKIHKEQAIQLFKQ